MEKKPEIQKIYSLSPMQEGMLFHSLMEQNSNTYFEQLSFNITGKIDIFKLKECLNLLVERHDVFRTVFIYEKIKNPKQVVLRERKTDIAFDDLSDMSGDERIKFIEGSMADDRKRGFNLSKDMPMRMAVFKIGQDEYKVIWSFHHIIMDGWCLGIIIKELFQIYQCISENKPVNLKPVIPYTDYIKWLEKQDNAKAAEYWSKYLKDYDSRTEVPSNFSKKPNEIYENMEIFLELEQKDAEELLNFAKSRRVTLNIVMQAIWGIILQHYNNSDDVVFGSVVSGRNPEVSGIGEMVGLFINTVPVRIKTEGSEMTFTDLLVKTQESLMLSEKFNFFSLPKIQTLTSQRQNIVNHILAFENYHKDEEFRNMLCGQEAFGLVIDGIEIFEQTNYDFNIIVMPDNKFTIKFAYNGCVYERGFVERIAGHFKSVIEDVVRNPDILVRKIGILTEEEKNQILFDFNRTKAKYPDTKTIQELFEEQVEKTPDKTAVIFDDKHMTYRELNEKSNQLAGKLRKDGVNEDSIVAIMLEPSIEMIIAALGVLKAGGAYLPIDPDYPQERIKFTLDDSGARVILSDKDISGTNALSVINVKDKSIFAGEGSNLTSINSPSSLAYIIYTSGTTGKPKGVMIEHRNVVRLLFNDKMMFDFNSSDIWTMFHSFCFDFSVWEIYGALLYGGKLVIVPKIKAKDTKAFLDILKREKVTILNQTPTAFYNLSNEELKHPRKELRIRNVIFGGEALKPVMLKGWKIKYPETKLINMYGITETTVHVTYKEISEKEIDLNISNIGKPIPTLTAYILDRNLKLLPVGIPGELCVGGDGVGRGYLNRIELTNEKFVQNPNVPGERIYRSGDLARLLPNGEMEYLGRIDHQVKIRGHRIELGEIENQLLKHNEVKETVVLAKEKADGEKCLCAYIVSNRELTISELRAHLKLTLPDYMVPAFFVKIDKIPLTINGKVDRKALLSFEKKMSTGSEYAAPSNEVEQKLSVIWKEVLRVNSLGVNDNFFSLGGDSLAIIRVLAGIIANGWNVSMQDFYKYQTIKELSDKIMGLDKEQNIGCQNDGSIYRRRISRSGNKIGTVVKTEFRSILLTGATGYLGIHILDRLLAETKADIYCLVRAESYEEAEQRLERLLKFYFNLKHVDLINKRIFVVKGDITEKRFGLNDTEYSELGQKAELIINTAASVKHYGEYKDFEKINVFGTREVLDFALKFRGKLAHISTMSVAGNVILSNSTDSKFTENDFYIGQNCFDNVYVKSKFEAENLVFKAIDSGLEANIFRVGNLTGRYDDGHFQKNISENNFYRAIRSIIGLGAVSEVMLNLDVEFTPIDLCSRCIVILCQNIRMNGKVFHLYNHNTIKMSELLKVFCFLGYPVRAMEEIQFGEFVKKVSENSEKREMLEGLVNYFSYAGHKEGIPVEISSEITAAYLENLGVLWPCIEEAYIYKLVKYMGEAGFLNRNK